VVVQITVVRVKLLVRTHTMSDVLICLLLRSVVGVFGKNFLWGHLKLLKEKLRRSFRDLIITGEELSRLELKVLLILLLRFNNVRLQRVLLNEFANIGFVLIILLSQLSCIVLLVDHHVEVSLQTRLHAGQFALHRRVPVVLDRVVSPTVEVLGDVSPPILQLPVLQKQDPFFLVAPVDLLDSGVQVVVPSFAALLALAAR